jgi:hypothetical protein
VSLELRVLAFASRGLDAPLEGHVGRPVGAEWLPSRLRRGTSVATRLVADLVHEVGAGHDLGAARLVLGSAWGEIDTAHTLMRMRHERDGALSPARFTLSVHSAPLSVLGIALGNTSSSTAIAAGPLTLAMAMLEGTLACVEAPGPVLVVVADETPPEALRADRPGAAGVAFLLGRGGEAGSHIRLTSEARASAGEPSSPRSAALAAGPLLAALRSGHDARVTLGEDHDVRWVAETRGGAHA